MSALEIQASVHYIRIRTVPIPPVHTNADAAQASLLEVRIETDLIEQSIVPSFCR